MSEFLPTLYKRDTTGRIRDWVIEIEDNKFRVTSGLVDGQRVTAEWTVCEGKNVGRANETTPEEQAMAEAKSHWTKKTQQGGYHENLCDVDKPKFFKPMTAKKYDDIKMLVFPVYTQPKLDGMRCIVKSDGMWSRQGKPIISAPHIFEQLKPLFNEYPDLVLDGELYNHDLKHDFAKIMSLCRKTKPTAADLQESAELVQYWMYDIPSCPGGYDDRLNFAQFMFERELDVLNGDCLQWCDTDIANDQDELDELFHEFLTDGYEGQMIRTFDGEYEDKRSKTLLKRKAELIENGNLQSFEDDEFPIVRIEEGKGQRSGMAGRVIFLDHEGRECKAAMIGSHEYCREVLRDKDQYVGCDVTVNFMKPVKEGGKPRFPRAKYLFKGQRDV